MNGFEKRTSEKKKNILETAFEIMNTANGVSELKIDELAHKAAVGKTSIFKYFGSKENLIHEVFKHFLTEIGDAARSLMAENKPFDETLIAMAQAKINHLDKVNRRFYLDLMEYVTTKNDKGLSVLMEEYSTESFHIMLDLFHRGRKEGKVDLRYSDEFLLLYFQALIEGISSPQVYDKILPYTTEWIEVIIRGIAPIHK